MKINCLEIAREIQAKVKKRLEENYVDETPPKAAIFYVGNDELTHVFIQKKKELAKEIGIDLEVIHYPQTPLFQVFATNLREIANSRKYHAVVVQRPLPPELSSPTLDNFIPLNKEVEAQKYKTPYKSPVGLTTLSILKYITTNGSSWEVTPKDRDFFKKSFKRKFVVLAGRGKTTGVPIANTLVDHKMALVITHKKTPDTDVFYKQADILITSTGQNIITSQNIKEGVTLINFGYHKEEGKTMGDYVEAEIAEKSAFYTPVINGTGPIMISYLMSNIVNAYNRQMSDKATHTISYSIM